MRRATRNVTRGAHPWIALGVIVSLAGWGCGKGKQGGGQSAGKSAMGGAAMTSTMAGAVAGGVAERPTPRERPRPAPAAQVGLKAWPAKWSKEVRKLHKQFRKLAKASQHQEALAVLAKGLALQPDNLDFVYKQAYIKALSGDQKGALVHVKRLLFAHYRKYAYRIATDKDFASLREAPHKAKLEALLAEARQAHVAAWKQAGFFVGASMRAFKYGKSVRGTQEIWGYVPATKRYVGVTYVGHANAMGYLLAKDRQALIYVAASQFVSKDGPPAFRDVEVHVLSLASGKLLKVFVPSSHPGKPYHGVVPEVGEDEVTRKAMGDEDPGVVRVQIDALNKGVYRLTFDLGDTAREAGDKLAVSTFKIDNDAVVAVADAPGPKARVVNYLKVRMCGAKAKRLHWARKINKDGGSFEVGGKPVTFACAGLIWPSPDKSHAVFQPYRYCNKKAQLEGLYVVDAAGKLTQVTQRHDAWDLTWPLPGQAFVQVGGQVAHVDVNAGTFTLLQSKAGHLRAFGPRAIPKCAD